MGFAPHLDPLRFIERREDHIPIGSRLDLGEIDPLRAWQGQGEKSGAADHANLFRAIVKGMLAPDLHGFREILAYHRPGWREGPIAGEHDVDPPGQRTPAAGCPRSFVP